MNKFAQYTQRLAAVVLLGVLTFGTSTLPSRAAPATNRTAAADCSGSKQQDGPRISVRIKYGMGGGKCRVLEMRAWLYKDTLDGYFHFWGPDGYARTSGTRTWTAGTWDAGDAFTTYPYILAWGGHLWCAKFASGNHTYDAQCVTV